MPKIALILGHDETNERILRRKLETYAAHITPIMLGTTHRAHTLCGMGYSSESSEFIEDWSPEALMALHAHITSCIKNPLLAASPGEKYEVAMIVVESNYGFRGKGTATAAFKQLCDTYPQAMLIVFSTTPESLRDAVLYRLKQYKDHPDLTTNDIIIMPKRSTDAVMIESFSEQLNSYIEKHHISIKPIQITAFPIIDSYIEQACALEITPAIRKIDSAITQSFLSQTASDSSTGRTPLTVPTPIHSRSSTKTGIRNNTLTLTTVAMGEGAIAPRSATAEDSYGTESPETDFQHKSAPPVLATISSRQEATISMSRTVHDEKTSKANIRTEEHLSKHDDITVRANAVKQRSKWRCWCHKRVEPTIMTAETPTNSRWRCCSIKKIQRSRR